MQSNTNAPKTAQRPYSPLLLLIIPPLLIAFALRIFRLDAQSLWWDEGISLNLAVSSFSAIAADRVINIHPPLYFFILKLWTAVTGVSPFSARYLSVLASFLQVAAVYLAARRWINQKAAWIALGLIVISPLSIIYGQETRVYALLPLIYLALLGLTRALIANKERRDWRLPLLLALAEWIGLHLHYMTAFVIVYAGIWTILALARQGRWQALRRWFIAQIGVGVASLPWFLAVAFNWTAVSAEASAGTYLAEPAPLDFLLGQVWTFHLTGLATALGDPFVRWTAALTAVLLIIALAIHSARPADRRTAVSLLAQWILPLSAAMVVWSVRAFSHPRYLVAFAIGLIPLLAFLSSRDLSGFKNLIGLFLMTTAVVLSIWGLLHYFFDPAYAKLDVRGAATWLEETAVPDDLILIPDTDWSLFFEYDGDADVMMPSLDNRPALWEKLGAATSAPRQLFTLTYGRGGRDWQTALPVILEGRGALLERREFGSLTVNRYAVADPIAPFAAQPVGARIGPLRLTDAWLESGAPAGGAMAIAAQWEAVEAPTSRLHLALSLRDGDNWLLSQADQLLLDENGRPTDRWQVGQTVTTYHLLPIPPAAPPLTYTVSAALYDLGSDGAVRPLDALDETGAPQGQEIRFPPVAVAPAPPELFVYAPAPPLPAAPLLTADGLTLLDAELYADEIRPGQPVCVRLLWEGGGDLPDLRPQVALMQEGKTLISAAVAPANGQYPTTLWGAGERVNERRCLTAPLEGAGEAQLVLTLGDSQLPIGAVTILEEARLFAPPPLEYPASVQFGDTARLVGYDLPQTAVSLDQPLPLTLYWQAVESAPPVDYAVFAHLLGADGRLIGQHDAPPDNGRRPTSGWAAEEYLIDPHLLTLREGEGAAGETAVIEIGLYDPLTGARLQTADGADFYLLPVQITVE